MHPSVLALCLVALQSLEPADSAPNPDSSPLLASNWGNQRRYVHLQTSSELSNFYLEISLHGHVRRSANRGSYSVVLLKAETRDRLAILGVKSNRFLCMDAEGKLYSSAVCNQEQCLFNHKLLENHRDVYYSAKTGMLVNLEGARQVYSAGQSPRRRPCSCPRETPSHWSAFCTERRGTGTSTPRTRSTPTGTARVRTPTPWLKMRRTRNQRGATSPWRAPFSRQTTTRGTCTSAIPAVPG
uniref:FGF n=1 Tax=Denticeps clupeoides TaxID=299321 RepID=A0AAY4BT31_9TELE